MHDGLPIVSITAFNKQNIIEGTPAEFILTAGPKNIEIELPIRIEYNVTQDGDFVQWRANRYFKMQTNSAILPIVTLDDAIKEDNGSIRVTLIGTESYNLSSNENERSAVVEIN